jgi:hypothetical protein
VEIPGNRAERNDDPARRRLRQSQLDSVRLGQRRNERNPTKKDETVVLPLLARLLLSLWDVHYYYNMEEERAGVMATGVDDL